MPPVPLTPTTRYFPPGTRKVYWVPVIGNYQAPLRSELNSGLDVSSEISAMTGWSVSAASVDVPDMGSRFTSQVPGRLTSATNDLECYISQNANDARGVFLLNTNGYICLLWEGDIVGQFMDVFPVRVMSAAMDTTVDDPGKCTFSFAVTRFPAIRIPIPG